MASNVSSKPRPYTFGQQLDRSQPGVRRLMLFLQTHWKAIVVDIQNMPDKYTPGDLAVTLTVNGKYKFRAFEVKCESRASTQTSNLAVEVWGDVENEYIGGPWATKADDYVFVYEDGLCVMMDRLKLVEWLETCEPERFQYREIDNYNPRNRNGGRYKSVIALVPREIAKAELGKYYSEVWLPPSTAYRVDHSLTKAIAELNAETAKLRAAAATAQQIKDAKKKSKPSFKKHKQKITEVYDPEYN